MSVVGSNITVDQGEFKMGFHGLIGGMRLPSFKDNPTELQEWIQSIQKKQVICLVRPGDGPPGVRSSGRPSLQICQWVI